MNLLVNFFEGCNEEILGKETEGRCFTVKWGEAPLERGDVMESGGGGGRGRYVKILRFSLNDGPMETVEYMRVNIWCMLDWIIGFCHKTGEIHFLDISCSTFSLFTLHLENSALSAHVKPSSENNSRNLLISIGVVIKINVYIYSTKLNFIKALFTTNH